MRLMIFLLEKVNEITITEVQILSLCFISGYDAQSL